MPKVKSKNQNYSKIFLNYKDVYNIYHRTKEKENKLMKLPVSKKEGVGLNKDTIIN